LTAILPCNDLDASEAFYAKLGFMREASHENYLILSGGKGWNIYLTTAVLAKEAGGFTPTLL
jgi:predicted lactoylglutathione lyase